MLKRVLLASAAAFLAVNLWTGAPLFAIWVGSKVAGETRVTIGSVFAVAIVLAALVSAITLALIRINAAYERLTGRPARERRVTWLRSMRAEGRRDYDTQVGVTALERIIMIAVSLAVIAFLVWFFVFARSPLPR